MRSFITPIPAYPKPGIVVETCLLADNMSDKALVQWRLLDEDERELSKGTVAIEGAVYSAWDNSNEAAHNLALSVVGAPVDLRSDAAKVLELEAEIQSMRDEARSVAAQEDAYKGLQAELSLVKGEIASKDAEIHRQGDKLVIAEAQLDSLRANLTDALGVVKSLTEERDSLKASLDSLKAL